QFDARLGIENACSKCHPGKSVAWLQAKVDHWYGRVKPHKPIVKALFDAAPGQSRQQAAGALLQPRSHFPMAQAAALVYFIKTYLQPNMEDLQQATVQKLETLAAEADPDVQALALMALHLARGQDPAVHEFLKQQLQTLGHREMAIRARWAVAADYMGTVYASQQKYAQAILGHKKALEIRPNDAVAWVNLGNAYGNRGQLKLAIAAFQRAAGVNPQYAMAWNNMGVAYMRLGEVAEAIGAYNQAIEVNPNLAEPYILMAQAYLQTGQAPMAIETLRLAQRHVPENETIRLLLQELKARAQQ
ncbi:MAG: tetratricopeptide repeat protein, partial [Calditrichaeota bacterium]